MKQGTAEPSHTGGRPQTGVSGSPVPEDPREIHDVLASESFGLLMQRSELIRVRVFLAVLLTLVVVAAVRRLIGGDMLNGPLFWWANGILVAAIAYECWMLRIISKAVARHCLIRERWWYVNAPLELGFPFAFLLISHLDSPQDIHRLTVPSLLIFPIILLLSVLRLRPLFTLALGFTAAALHCGLVARAAWVAGTPRGDLSMYLSYGVLLAVTGLAGEKVARAVRTYLSAAAAEATALAHTRRELDAVEHDLEIARDIQRSLLPQTAPNIPGFDIVGMSRPAQQTGGDYYDWQTLPDGRLALVIADATGHGIGPALLTAVCRAYTRASTPLMTELHTLMHRINVLVHSDVQGTRFITLALAVLDPVKAEMSLLSAGHGPTLLLRAATGKVEQFGGHGIPLGLDADEIYEQQTTLKMEPDDVMLLITDGIFEWQRADGQAFGTQRLVEALCQAQSGNAQAILDHVDQAVRRFAEGSPQADDVTALVIKRCSVRPL